jgi:excisionase family DNA binding protein
MKNTTTAATASSKSQAAPGRRIEPLAYTVDEAAKATRLSRDLLYDEMRAGRLAYLKVGRRRIITRQHLDAFLTRRAS